MPADEIWSGVREELDIWARSGRTALFWWRDDDAADATPEVKALLTLARQFGVTVGLSAIPARATARLAHLIVRDPHAQVLVHGLKHENHADGPRMKKRELGGSLSLEACVTDIAQGLALARARFGTKCLPVLVPPWNRITPRAVKHLPALGYRGLSTWKPRVAVHPAPGLLQVNAHLDPINWRRGQVVKSEAAVAGLLLRKLRWRRAHPARAREPLGLLTHHAHWSPALERVVAGVLAATVEHRAVKFLTPAEAFGLEPGPRK